MYDDICQIQMLAIGRSFIGHQADRIHPIMVGQLRLLGDRAGR